MKLSFSTAMAAGLTAGLALAAPAWAQSATGDYQPYRGIISGGSGTSTVITSPALGGGVTTTPPAAPGFPAAPVPGGAIPTPPPDPVMTPLPADAAARTEVRLQALEEQIRQLTGRVEEAQFQNQQLKEQLQRMQADTDLRFRELQGGGQAAATPAPVPGAAPPAAAGGTGEGVLGTMPTNELQRDSSGGAALKGNTPKEQYDYAYSLVMTDRDKAEQALKAFLKAHPDDGLAGNAHYWLGETYFVKGDYKQAAVSFMEGYRKFPKGQKASHNLLKLALSMSRMGDTKAACTAFARLDSEYPDVENAVKRVAQNEKQKLKCP